MQLPSGSVNLPQPARVPLASVPLLDVARQHEPLHHEIRAAIDRVCTSGRFVLGPDCTELEKNVAAYTQAKHAIACASGSDALLLALMALRILPGDEVILPRSTFFPTVSAAWRLGAMPVFADIDPVTYNLDPKCVKARISRATKAILPVHLYGQCADMDALRDLATAHGLPLIEDAAQAIGAEHRGRAAGTIGDIGCFSFYPTKNLGGFGDGGLVTTNRDDLAERLKLLRAHGMEPRYYHQVVGINSRLDTIQAAVLNVKFPHLDTWADQRRANADRYAQLFQESGLSRLLALPTTSPHCKHVWNQYVIRVPNNRRDLLRQYLAQANVGTEIYYPVPLHQQACFRGLGYGKGSLPHSEQAAHETLALPIFPELQPAELQTVVFRIAEFFGIRRPATDSAVRRPNFLDRAADKAKKTS
ncbi:MAG: DegT/DnrJ/EryC1/StrS family aminotransferase [Planctomycetota bacterium]|nr:DegT/DnrJ/EryC1/StrS family aminotransferase [Planctomycetota bacterium]